MPFSFKEIDDEGLISYVADPERCARVAGIAVRHARLRHIPAAGQAGRARALGVPDQARPHRQRRRAGHPGLRGRAAAGACATPATTSATIPGVDAEDGDALIHALIERGGQDPDWLTDEQLAGNPVRISAKDYRDWFATLPAELRRRGRPSTGARRRVSCSSTAAATPTARSSSPRCRPATS